MRPSQMSGRAAGRRREKAGSYSDAGRGPLTGRTYVRPAFSAGWPRVKAQRFCVLMDFMHYRVELDGSRKRVDGGYVRTYRKQQP